MKLKCPACGNEMTLDEAARGTEAEALARAAALFGADWERIGEYVDGFRARRDRDMPLKKRLRLLREVWEMWREGRFQFDGREYVIGREEFRKALDQVANRELAGLKNHNYLKQVMKAAAQEWGAKQEKALREKEAKLRSGSRTVVEEARRENDATGEEKSEMAALTRMILFGTPEEKAAATTRRDEIMKALKEEGDEG